MSSSDLAFSQDETFFRQLFAGEHNPESIEEIPEARWSVARYLYQVDLTGDRLFEGIVYEKRDAQDWLHIHDSQDRRVFSTSFQAHGIDARPYRVELRSLSKDVSVLIVYYFEGYIPSYHFLGTGRLYFITIVNGDLDSLNVSRGPKFWRESQAHRQGISKSRRPLRLQDLNHNGDREIIVGKKRQSDVFYFDRNLKKMVGL